jgi:hypothetical protein
MHHSPLPQARVFTPENLLVAFSILYNTVLILYILFLCRLKINPYEESYGCAFILGPIIMVVNRSDLDSFFVQGQREKNIYVVLSFTHSRPEKYVQWFFEPAQLLSF